MKNIIIALLFTPLFTQAQNLQFSTIKTCQSYMGGTFCQTDTVYGEIQILDEFTILITGEVEEFKTVSDKIIVVVEPKAIRFEQNNLSITYHE